MARRPRVLIALDYYLPGVNAGGPVRSIANLVERLADDVDFLIVTRDRDLGERQPYAGMTFDEWVPVGRARVRYMRHRSPGAVLRLVRQTPHDVLYLGSYFSPSSVELLWARRIGMRTARRCVLSPRGQLGAGALALNARRKRALITAANVAGAHRGWFWHATTAEEAQQIRDIVRPRAPIIVAANLPSDSTPRGRPGRKVPGALRIVTIARVHPMKNILDCVRWLAEVGGEIHYDVIGPLENRPYVADCQRAAASLPPSIRVHFCGSLPHAEVVQRLGLYDLFLLPTRGENFAHSIFEALSAGVPVLVSDRTPWRGLEVTGAGWDLPLESPQRFIDVLAACVSMDADEHASRSEAASTLARDTRAASMTEAVAAYRELFLVEQ